ncbi:UBP-type zinc finger domain-containing protein [Streptomyces sp. TP-A0874]|uniref:UBP-type zinc finger domain-containing protein n=1 Tax=Streptomyces sp. TP-A0874 TaxID=549819 RepID=UPI000853A58D|nr:UBP-type zinc finger domain-containing protein [Streptomyces sp. TP-A0874]
MSECPHISELPHPEPIPGSDTCLECLRIGSHPVQLRKCLACGNVACCDSSPHQHATHHFGETGHPVIRSYETGEDWRWCFRDQRLV